MRDLNDAELLSAYAARRSEEAFSVLVDRYVSLVHSAAMRQVQNAHLAQEVTQAVFIILAQKAGSLNERTVLAGWLCRTAHFVARNALKAEFRRQHREQEAYMQSLLNEPETSAWTQLSPLLDEAVAQLSELDRSAVVLRFYQQKSLAEVGSTLGVDSDTAQKRVERAVDKMRKFFSKRGVVLSAGVIIGVISTNSIQAAPIGLAASAVAAAQRSAASASTLTLVKGALKLMAWTKMKISLALGAAVILAAGTTTLAVKHKTPEPAALDIARKAQEKYAALSSYSDSGTVLAEVGGTTTPTTFTTRLQRPNLYRVDWMQTGGFFTGKGAVWSDGTGDFMQSGRARQEPPDKPEKMRNRQLALGAAGGISSGVSSSIPTIFFKDSSGDYLKVAASGRFPITQEKDEKVGDFNCFVLSGSLPSMKLPQNDGSIGKNSYKLWIGREDYLIHKTQNSIEMAIKMPSVPISDELVKNALAENNKEATPAAMAAKRAEMEKAMKTGQEKAEKIMKAGKFVFTQIHENIKVNETFSAVDFAQ